MSRTRADTELRDGQSAMPTVMSSPDLTYNWPARCW